MPERKEREKNQRILFFSQKSLNETHLKSLKKEVS